ncbi:23 kDa integral membrane protein-like [Pararge aegeria]|nr:23 kDa integral membrane protein-like [Pararge aegeria]
MYITPIIGKECLRVTLLMLNGFCFLIAIGFISSSIANINIMKQYGDDSSNGVVDAVTITIGLLTLVVAGFGSIGAYKGNVETLHMYVVLLIIMGGLEIVILFSTADEHNTNELRISQFMSQNYFLNTTDMDVVAHAKFWDEVQSKYKCCGFNGPEDYITSGKDISLSCCQQAYDARFTNYQDQLYNICLETASYYNVGCEKQRPLMLKLDSDWLGIFIFMYFWVQAIELCLAVLVIQNETQLELEMKLMGYHEVQTAPA